MKQNTLFCAASQPTLETRCVTVMRIIDGERHSVTMEKAVGVEAMRLDCDTGDIVKAYSGHLISESKAHIFFISGRSFVVTGVVYWDGACCEVIAHEAIPASDWTGRSYTFDEKSRGKDRGKHFCDGVRVKTTLGDYVLGHEVNVVSNEVFESRSVPNSPTAASP